MMPAFALWRAVETDSATPDLDARPHGVDGQWSRFVRPGATTTTSEFAGSRAVPVKTCRGDTGRPVLKVS
jgi:hypothetical protein